MKMKQNSKKYANIKEVLIKNCLLIFASISILTTVGIVFTLMEETIIFFGEVSIIEFFTSTKWTPLLEPQNFGILPLITGTLMIALGSSLVSLPLGLGSAIYLSEYAPKKVRKIIKPMLEVLAGVPSIVYGFFALTVITPFIQSFLPQTEVFNAASASIAVGIMTIPLVASLSEDAMMAIPNSMRYGAYALGSTRLEVTSKIVLPAAISGIASAFVLAISRAIGETMIVAIAAGASPTLTFNPLKSIQTMTGFMVNTSLGDVPHGSVAHRTIFAVGTMLFLITLVMNMIAKAIVKKYREVY